MKKFFTFFIVIILIAGVISSNIYVYGSDYLTQSTEIYKKLKYDNLTAPSYIVMEHSNGQVLFEKNSREQRPVAGLVKLMTAYLALENIKTGKRSLTDIVTASRNSVGVGGNHAFVYAGEKFSYERALKAVIINNCNDVAIALAENIAGSQEKFVELMNEKAKELGMNDTSFYDCTGLSENNKSTAYDMALLSRALILNHPDYLNYSSTWIDKFRDEPNLFNLYNTNRLIKFMPGNDGLKYGYSPAALSCLSATFDKDGRRLICVALGLADETNALAESRYMLEYGFENYELTELVEENLFVKEITVKKGVEKKVGTVIKGKASAVINKHEKDNIVMVTDMVEEVTAPVKKGDKVGKVTFLLNDEKIAEVDVVIEKDVKKANWFQLLIRWILEWFGLE